MAQRYNRTADPKVRHPYMFSITARPISGPGAGLRRGTPGYSRPGSSSSLVEPCLRFGAVRRFDPSKGRQVGSVDSFRKLGLSDDRLAAIEAQTGTGKTGGFMLPIMESLTPKGGLQALVLCPTRELAQQVRDESMILAKGSIFRAEVVVGGVSYGPQNDAFRDGVEIIVATPGRLIDHMDRGNVDFSAVRFLVLDEGDRLLAMGFRPQIEQLLRKVPRKRQTMLFSATMPN